MEELKKSQMEVLQERIGVLEQENKELIKNRDLYEGWWRKSDAKSQELAEAIKSIGIMAGIIYNSAKS